MSPVAPKLLPSVVRSAVARRDLRALSLSVRSAGAAELVRAWPRLRPLERVASFRVLSSRSAAEAFAALPADGKWLAYLGEVSEGAAPLLEGSGGASARLLRRASTSERAAMRRALA